MKALLIDPENRFISSLIIKDDDYQHIRQVIGCKSLAVARTLHNGDAVFVDEGILLDTKPRHLFRLPGQHRPIAGRAVIVGTDPLGESVDARTSEETLCRAVSFLSRLETGPRPVSAWYLATA